MADTQRDTRAVHDSSEQIEESGTPEQAVVATVARMLANPRRVRLD